MGGQTAFRFPGLGPQCAGRIWGLIDLFNLILLYITHRVSELRSTVIGMWFVLEYPEVATL